MNKSLNDQFDATMLKAESYITERIARNRCELLAAGVDPQEVEQMIADDLKEVAKTFREKEAELRAALRVWLCS